MLQVDLDNILTEEDALQHIKDIFEHVENAGEIYVVTKGGRPAVAIVSVDMLEHTDVVNPQAVAAQAPSMTSEAVAMPESTPITPPAAPAPVTPPTTSQAPAQPAVPPAPPVAPITEPLAPPTPSSPDLPTLSGTEHLQNPAPRSPLPDMPAEDLSSSSPLA